ncbi:hypothetical protein GCM10017714_23880 [Curtobacterium pusillum]|uniref:Uncharacterized protein n=1 Tax=Curtobacterium pusillum TaxID=69373 RepID=A0ABX2MA92_9MICO|nr:hypothetical protein [Curtobacterium pusillum]NUU14957.1 hypothetical protein [Curtobacterium pusillum]GLK32520.1 hypothetical protein GCM10017610_28050 [Curtobacterium pusillum]
MQDPQDFQLGRQTAQDLYRPKLPYRAPEHSEAVARPRTADGDGGQITMGIPYDAPGFGAGASDGEPVTRLGLVWRAVASLVLAAVGVNAVVQIVRMLAQDAPAWVGALGMAVVAMLALAYPVVNLVRLVRAARRRRQRPAA